jgi:beta-glucanase (GH16 family)
MRTIRAFERSNKPTSVRIGLLLAVVTALFLGGLPASHAEDVASSAKKPSRGKSLTATLTSLPPIVAPGTSPSAPSSTGSLLATFRPAAPGRRVVLEKKAGRTWKVVDTAREDRWGSAAFAPGRGTYRARTTAGGRTFATRPVTTQRWTPEFEDTFSGTDLDTAVWNDQKREHESVYAPRTCARVDPAARRVEGGVLHLGVAADPQRVGTPCAYSTARGSGTSPYLLNSQVATEYTRSFRHGIVAARIKPQRAKGMHSGFWMLPQGTTYVDGVPAGGTEIDVMEFFGETGRGDETIGSHVHYYEPGWNKVSLGDMFPTARRSLAPQRSWWQEFHVFSVEWTAREYIFRIDGREYYREPKAVSQVPQYLVLSNLTSDYELGELTSDELGDTAQVDWVRVFDATSRQTSRTTYGRKAS